jgi:hypothetical protein
MGTHNEHNNSLRRYLLGELSEQEREQIEQLLLSDDSAYQELLFAEDDLIDEYVFKALPEEDQTKFRRRFLSVPELQRNISFAASLRKHALETKPPIVSDEPVRSRFALFDWLKKLFMQPTFAASFATVLLAAIALNVWLFRQNSQLRGRVAQLEAQQTTPAASDLEQQLASVLQRNDQLSAELLRQQQLLEEESRKLQLAQAQQKGSTPGTNTANVLAVTLTSGFVRDAGAWTKVSRKPDTREVNFRLDVAVGDYVRYEAVVETVEGERKWSKKNLKSTSGKFVQFNVPARVLLPNDYRIVLNGTRSSGARSEIGSYYFRVSE